MEQQIEGSPVSLVAGAKVPLCVDLDGTLVKSDTLVDSVLVLARHYPLDLFRIPGWIAQGKAAFKRHITNKVMLDVEHLPYNRKLMTWLRQQHSSGRKIYLVTAADRPVAERVADFLGIFCGVMGSDGRHNLAGVDKLAAMREHFGCGFSYIGNALPDAPALTACHEPMTANSNGALRSALRQAQVVPVNSFEDRSRTDRAWLRAIRLHQWAKNVLVFMPMLLGHAWNAGTLVGAVIAFLGMGLCASSTYIVNDLLDIETDRRHPRKRRRPFASGDLPAIAGTVVAVSLFCCSMLLAFLLPRIALAVGRVEVGFDLLGWLAIYAVSTLAYSLFLKKQMLIDVFMLSGLYTLRILAGSAATGVPVSPWLAAFSIFFFLSLAFLKRFSELKALQASDAEIRNGRGYQFSDMEQLRAFGTGAGCAAAVVLTLYINDPAASHLYHHPARIWLATPVLLLWLFRMWILASRGEMNEDPVDYAITDKRSLLLGAVVAAIVFLAL